MLSWQGKVDALMVFRLEGVVGGVEIEGVWWWKVFSQYVFPGLGII